MSFFSFNSFSSPFKICLIIAGDNRGPQLIFKYPSNTILSDCNNILTSNININDNNDKSILYNNINNFTAQTFAKIFYCKPNLCNNIFNIEIDNYIYISYPIILYSTLSNEVSYFNIIFIIEKYEVYINMFKSIIISLSKSIEHEETNRSYLTNEFQKINNLKEEFLVLENNDPLSISSNREDSYIKHLIKSSSLASLLADLHDSIYLKGSVNLLLNGWMELQFSLNESTDNINNIRPYHTLLLLETKEILLASLPIECSQTLKSLISSSSPRKSFSELANELDIPLFQMYRMASHLVYWKKARIIDTLAKANIYVLHHGCNIHINSSLFHDFNHSFPSYSLRDILYMFSSPLPLSEHLSHFLAFAQLEIIEILCWLLKRDCVMQLFQFIYLIDSPPSAPVPPTSNNIAPLSNSSIISTPSSPSLIPSAPGKSNGSPATFHGLEGPRRATSILSPALNGASEVRDSGMPTFKLTPASSFGALNTLSSSDNNPLRKASSSGNISSMRRKAISENIHGLNNSYESSLQLFNLFKKLLPYFDGKHHMQEIMWAENVTRKEINTLLSVYSESITKVIHE